jgi:hypothetical protein
MKVRTDKQHRLYGRAFLKADTVYEAEADGSGRITLIELAPRQAPRAKLVRRRGRTYLKSSREVTNEDVAAAMAQFP